MEKIKLVGCYDVSKFRFVNNRQLCINSLFTNLNFHTSQHPTYLNFQQEKSTEFQINKWLTEGTGLHSFTFLQCNQNKIKIWLGPHQTYLTWKNQIAVSLPCVGKFAAAVNKQELKWIKNFKRKVGMCSNCSNWFRHSQPHDAVRYISFTFSL